MAAFQRHPAFFPLDPARCYAQNQVLNTPLLHCSAQNEVLKEVLAASGIVSVLASEEDDEPVVVHAAAAASGGQAVAAAGQEAAGKLAVVFDPLDGSRNIEVSIPTGEDYHMRLRICRCYI